MDEDGAPVDPHDDVPRRHLRVHDVERLALRVAHLVERAQPLEQIDDDPEPPRERNRHPLLRASALDLGKYLAVDPVGHEEHRARPQDDVAHGDEVRVTQMGEALGVAKELRRRLGAHACLVRPGSLARQPVDHTERVFGASRLRIDRGVRWQRPRAELAEKLVTADEVLSHAAGSLPQAPRARSPTSHDSHRAGKSARFCQAGSLRRSSQTSRADVYR